MVNRSDSRAPPELCRIWPEGWDQSALIKIGHPANKQAEGIGMEVSTARSGWTDRCVGLSVILDLLGD